jgi:hypothetical protein
VLASWELSKPERNRAEVAGLVTGGSGVTAFWPQLDLFAPQLDPFIQACRDAQQPVEVVEAALRFFDAVHQIGPSLVRNVLKSRDFRRAAEVIARVLPEGDSPPKPSQKPTPATKLMQRKGGSPAASWPSARTSRQDIYLSLAGPVRMSKDSYLVRGNIMDIYYRGFDSSDSPISSGAKHLTACAARLLLAMLRSIQYMDDAAIEAFNKYMSKSIIFGYCA